MTHKLPELFDIDNARPYRYETVVPITAHEEIKAWRERRNELTAAAAQYVKRQRGDGANG